MDKPTSHTEINHMEGDDNEQLGRSRGNRRRSNPWGRPQGGARNGSGQRHSEDKGPDLGNTIDFEQIARKMSSQFSRGSGSGGGAGGSGGGGGMQFSRNMQKRGGIVAAVLVFFGWLATGIYTVQPDQQGIVLRFGKYIRTSAPGLHMHLPYPIETVLLPRVTQVNRVNVGFRSAVPTGGFGRSTGNSTQIVDLPEESLILTGDENIVDVDFSVFWLVSDAPDFLFNIRSPEQFIKAVSESAMREIIGTRDIQAILTQGRAAIQEDARALIQSVLDSFNAGVSITQVQLEKVDPPEAVIDAFRDVQAARADKQRLQNEADSYANKVIPEARGRASELVEQAEGYRERVVAEARGQASRFEQLYEEYRKAPDVTRYRIYMETMEKVLGGTNKVLLDSDESSGSGVIPYLPLSQLAPQSRTNPAQSVGGSVASPRGGGR